jgi:ABC-2 type transport system ATP-binding protein
MSSLTVNKVTKRFKTPQGKELIAVNGISLAIEPGTIHGLLGPNGAGKSTLINMISGILVPDEGAIEIFGVDVVREPEKAKLLLGVVPQEIVVEMAFTCEEVLYYFGGMYGVPRSERSARALEILKDLNLEEKMHERARTLSGGMKRRLMIAKALMHRPKLLILDEPTAGVDVALRQKIWELIRRLNAEGTTVLFTTHYLEEAEQLCESVTLVNHGTIIKSGKTKDIQKEFSKNAIHFELFDRSTPHLEGVSSVGSEYEYPLTDLSKDIAKLATHYGGNIKTVRSEVASLEQIFLKLTQEK